MIREPSQARFPAEYFINREVSLLKLQRRVLAQAADERVPLLERLRFLCIVSSNLDEFFEIRVAGLKEQIKLGSTAAGADGMPPGEVYQRVTDEVHEMVAEQYTLLNDTILPALEREGIVILRRSRWTEPQKAWVKDYFEREVMPLLTPSGLDPAHPFPRVLNKSLNFAGATLGARRSKQRKGKLTGAGRFKCPMGEVPVIPPGDGEHAHDKRRRRRRPRPNSTRR